MSKKDTKSIKYVLNEMDPAEKIEFEREMNRDPDLLIEVESIKRMQRRLKQLPEFTPPRELSESLLSFAAEESMRTREGGKNMRFFLAAAVVLFGLTTGSLFLDNPFNTDANYQATINLSSPAMNVLDSNQITGTEKVTPWVDRNNVLKLSGFETGSFNSQSGEINENQSKLRPADNTLYRNTVTRSLHLTGSNR
jgi:hypothetical protein